MSKIITTIDRVVYDSSYNLQSYSEKSLERWLLKYKTILYPDYFCFQSGYNFYNRKGEPSAADLILIARDFSEWKIVEVELAAKSLTHTIFQLGVFTDLALDVDEFSKHCQRKVDLFHGKYQKELNRCLATKPEVLVVFDYDEIGKVREVKNLFPMVSIAFCEIYQTTRHNGTVLRIFGKRNYIAVDSIYLTPRQTNKSIYSVSDERFFKKIKTGRLNYVCLNRAAHLEVVRIGKSIKIKIDDHPYNEDSVLILERTIADVFYLKAINPK